MANVLTAIVPKILAFGLMALRETALMPQLVNGDYSRDAAKKGSTIDVPVPVAQAVSDVTPSATPVTPASTTPTTVQIPLDKWKKTDFHLTDKETHEIDAQAAFYPMQVSEAARALANQVNSDILANYTGVYGYAGTAGTTPFATDVLGATDSRKVLASQLCPKPLRRFLLDADAEANALALSAFSDVSNAGDAGAKREGEIGRKFGFDWYMEDALPTHTLGSAGTELVDQVDVAIGDVTVHMDGFTTKPSVGDVFTVAGDSQTYVVTSSSTLAGTDSDIGISPPAKVAWADNAVVTFKASHVVNLAFHRNAFAFANRPADGQMFSGGNEIQQLTDPVTGITMMLEVERQNKQTRWEFSMLYGSKLVRPELASRLAG